MKKEELLHSIYYSSKSIENPEAFSKQSKIANNNNPAPNTEVKINASPNKTRIETIKVTYDDSIYNDKNFGYEQEYHNEQDYYGSGGNKNIANQANIKKTNKKQKIKNTNANDNNDYFGYDYQYEEGYGNNNFQASNKNYYNNYGGYINKQSYKGNNNYEY